MMNPLAVLVAQRSSFRQFLGRKLIRRRALVPRPVSTCVALQAKSRRGQALPTAEERLVALQSTEKRIAALAVCSLVVGYVALKVAFSDLASKAPPKSSGSGSGTGMGPPRPLVLAGPSGSGKSTLLKLLFEEFPDTFGFSVSHTTRSPRSGEKDGREYHFTSREEMKRSIEAGNFIEWAEFSGNMYGTSKQAVKDVQLTGKICVLDIDIQGVMSMKKTDLEPLYVFIKPPSVEELERRLRSRKTDSEESITRRLERAKTEMRDAEGPGVFDQIVVNDDLQRAYQSLRTTVTQEMGLLSKETSTNSTTTES